MASSPSDEYVIFDMMGGQHVFRLDRSLDALCNLYVAQLYINDDCNMRAAWSTSPRGCRFLIDMINAPYHL